MSWRFRTRRPADLPPAAFFCLAVALLAVIHLYPPIRALAASQSLLRMEGSPVPGGGAIQFTPEDTTFDFIRFSPNEIFLVIGDPQSNWWTLQASVPHPEGFAPGVYDAPARPPFLLPLVGSVPRLFAGRFDGGTYATRDGSFEVKRILGDGAGGLQSIWIRFEQRGRAVPYGLTGEFRWNVEAPVSVEVPLHVWTQRGSSLVVAVTTTHESGTVPSLSAIGLPTGATFLDRGDGTGALHWTVTGTPGLEYPVVIQARMPDGSTDQSTTVLDVSGETRIRFGGDPGVGPFNGRSFDFGPDSGEVFLTMLGNLGPEPASLSFLHFPTMTSEITDQDWRIDFIPPLDSTLHVGSYDDLQGFGPVYDPAKAGFNLYTSYTASYRPIPARFSIRQIVYGRDAGTIASYWARFEGHRGDPVLAMVGDVRWNADVPFAVDAPLILAPRLGNAISFDVRGTGSDAPTFSVVRAPERSALTAPVGNAARFTWLPRPGETGLHIVTIAGDDHRGDLDTSSVRITVMPRTIFRISSDWNDPIGAGVVRTYGTDDGSFISGNPYSSPAKLRYFTFKPFSGDDAWTITYAAADGSTPSIGRNEGATSTTQHVGGTPYLAVYRNGATPLPGHGWFELMPRAPGGNARSMFDPIHLYFSFFTTDSSAAITGEVQVNADPSVDVRAPLSKAGREGEVLSLDISGEAGDLPVSYRIEGAPAGALFRDNGDGTALLTWTPRVGDAGVYTPRLFASNGLQPESAVPLRLHVAEVPPSPARAFTTGGDGTLRLFEQDPTWSAQVEPSEKSFATTDIDPATIRMTWAPASGAPRQIHAIGSKRQTIRDVDRNGVPDLAVSFSREDLRSLFEPITGHDQVTVAIEGLLTTGGRFLAPLTLSVLMPPGQTKLAALPNPLNPETSLRFTMGAAGQAKLRIYDVSGRLVATLLDGTAAAGVNAVRWDGRNRAGGRVASGVYFAILDAGGARRTARLVVLK